MSWKNKKLINFHLSNYCTPMSLVTLLSSFLFNMLSFFSCVIATLSLNFQFAILFSVASISISSQLGVFLLFLRCSDRPVIFFYNFFIIYVCLMFLNLFSIVLSFIFSNIFLLTRTGYLVYDSTLTTTFNPIFTQFPRVFLTVILASCIFHVDIKISFSKHDL